MLPFLVPKLVREKNDLLPLYTPLILILENVTVLRNV